jgi:hypothetical protein
MMSITPYLNGYHFDPETKRVLALALEMVCVALRTGDCDDHVKRAVATNSPPWAKPESAIPMCCVTER